MSVVDVQSHDLWAVDAQGSRCSCGTVSVTAAAHLEHLGEVTLLALGVTRPLAPVVALRVPSLCIRNGCVEPHHARGMCKRHYKQDFDRNRERRAA